MKRILLLLSLVVCVIANFDSSITRFASQINVDGTYGFEVAQSNGAEYKEVGIGGQYAEGGYAYISPEGERIELTYTADANGFHPVSSVLPTPPPIPAYILRSIEYIRAHPTPEELADQKVRATQF